MVLRSKGHQVDVWPAFADLLGGISILLLLAVMVEQRSAARLEDVLETRTRELQEARKKLGVTHELVDLIKTKLEERGIHSNLNEYGNLEISADVLFSSGEEEIPARSREYAIQLGDALISLLKDRDFSQRVALVVIIGHTDQVGSADHNLLLSVHRAQRLVNLWLQNRLKDTDQDPEQRCVAAKILAAGVGEGRPSIVQESSDACGNAVFEREGCRANRRIELRVVAKGVGTREVAGCP